MSKFENSITPIPGYAFSPKRDPHSPGHPRLDIVIASEPSDAFFDPLEVQLSILTSKDWGHSHQLDHIKIFHPWPNQRIYRAAPGMVIIMDRIGKEAEVFTFGGTLLIEIEETKTICTLESDAPIIDTETVDHVIKSLIDETEIILAQRRAAWGTERTKFESRLAEIPPHEFYAVCLENILTNIEQFHRQDILDIQGLIHLIKQERSSLGEAGLWPQSVPFIEDVL